MSLKHNIRRLTMAALGAALVCISTRIFQFPIPLGYAHLGNCILLLFAVYFDPWIGAFAGGVGSALADLLSYPEWALPTLLIKSLMGLIAAVLSKRHGQPAKLRNLRTFLAVVSAMIVMIGGYFAAGSLLYGSAAISSAQLPGLGIEGIIGIILFYGIAASLEASGLLRHILPP